MSYVRRETQAGKFVFTKYYHTGRHHQRGEKRVKRMQPSPESVRQANRKRATEKLQWLLNENFTVDDWWITFTYEGAVNKRRTLDEMRSDRALLLKAVRKWYARRSEDFKFVDVLRVGKRGSRHLHAVWNAPELTKKEMQNFRAVLKRAWPWGFVKIVPIYEQDDTATMNKLANYMIEESEITRETLGAPSMKRYSRSRNLRVPVPVITVVTRSSTWRKTPKPPKGYQVIRETLNFSADLYGHEILEYICVRVE